MSNSIPFQRVKGAIDTAETVLCECFDMLLTLKHPDGDITKAILEFQPKLADTLFNLMLFYNELQAEKKNLIANKLCYLENDFIKAMTSNKIFSKAVRDTIEIGKSLGDAFAWIFYRDNFAEIGKHLDRKSVV